MRGSSFDLRPSWNWALFLDLDGTLLDIAPAPSSVTVPDGLIADLMTARRALGGALAVVSGRALDDVDRLLDPLRLPGGGEHGGVVRDATGRLTTVGMPLPRDWMDVLKLEAAKLPGLVLEPKSHGVALHYRLAPGLEADARRLVESCVAADPDHFEILPARMAVEIRPRGVSKAVVVTRLMETPPFAERLPVFVGDDVTDEDGMREAEARGGAGIRVSAYFGGEPAQVRAWLKRFAALDGRVISHADS